jgi:hypothetical protein
LPNDKGSGDEQAINIFSSNCVYRFFWLQFWKNYSIFFYRIRIILYKIIQLIDFNPVSFKIKAEWAKEMGRILVPAVDRRSAKSGGRLYERFSKAGSAAALHRFL